MIICSPYTYKPLERIDTEHGRRYLTSDGKALPSVTTILSATKDMTHLNQWVERIGLEESERIKLEASTIGTGLHANLENYILGREISGSYISKTLANVIIKRGLVKVGEVWGIEVPLYRADLYAGTADVIGLHEGIPSIMDFKNSIREKKKEWIEEYFLQLAAYSMAHNEMFDTDIKKGVIMMVTRDGKYQEFVIEGAEFESYQLKWAERVVMYYDKYMTQVSI
jgi:genome maintenance exonuclease 1